MKRNLILIGYMGSGKTTVGQVLAERLGCSFRDTDHLIEEGEGCSISEIFSRFGENYFRRRETACLQQLMEENALGIISVGGGTPLRAENRELLKKLGRIVYLKADPMTIYERIKEDQSRPLLQTEDPLKKITNMLAERESFYRECTEQIVWVDGKTAEEIAEEIVKDEDTGNQWS